MESHLALVSNQNTESSADVNSAHSNLMLSYQMALNTSLTLGTQAWLMSLVYLPFGVLMAVWSAFPVATDTGVPLVNTLVGLAVTFAGLLATVGMGTHALRTHKQVQLWRNMARELEAQLGLDMLKRDQALNQGESVTAAGERFRLSGLERGQKYSAFHVFYGLFSVVFVFLIMANLLKLGRVM